MSHITLLGLVLVLSLISAMITFAFVTLRAARCSPGQTGTSREIYQLKPSE